MGKLLDMLSGKESKVVEKAYKKFWDILKPAMEAEEQKSEQNSKFKTAGQRAGFDMRGLK
jgi:hypothetical protein